MNTSKNRKFVDTKFRKSTINTSNGQKIIRVKSHAKVAMKKICIYQIVKSFVKAKDTILKSPFDSQKALLLEQSSKIENLII